MALRSCLSHKKNNQEHFGKVSLAKFLPPIVLEFDSQSLTAANGIIISCRCRRLFFLLRSPKCHSKHFHFYCRTQEAVNKSYKYNLVIIKRKFPYSSLFCRRRPKMSFCHCFYSELLPPLLLLLLSHLFNSKTWFLLLMMPTRCVVYVIVPLPYENKFYFELRTAIKNQFILNDKIKVRRHTSE